MSLKKFVFIVFILLNIGGNVFAGPNDSAIIRVDMIASTEEIEDSYSTSLVGENFSIALWIERVKDLKSFTVKLKIDSKKVTYNSCVEDSFSRINILKIDSANTLFTPSIQGNTITLTGSVLFGQIPTSQSGLLGIINFKSNLKLGESYKIEVSSAKLTDVFMVKDVVSSFFSGLYSVNNSPIIDSIKLSKDTINVGDSTFIQIFASDPDGNPLSYFVHRINQTDTLTKSSSFYYTVSSFVNPQDTLIVQVTDGNGGIDKDSIILSITNIVRLAQFIKNNPGEFKLHNNFPNPFSSHTIISFTIPKAGGKSLHTTIKIYTLEGELVRNLVNKDMRSGYHQITFDGYKNNRIKLPPGMYICRMNAGNYKKNMKIVLSR